MTEEKETEQGKVSYLMLTLDKKTYKPNIPSCGIFVSHAEALKAKGFMRGSGFMVLIVPIPQYNEKEQFCKNWERLLKEEMVSCITKKSGSKHV